VQVHSLFPSKPSFPPSFSLLQARSTSISIHTQPSRSSETKLGTATIPELHLGPHDADRTSETVFIVRDVNKIEVCAFHLPSNRSSFASWFYPFTSQFGPAEAVSRQRASHSSLATFLSPKHTGRNGHRQSRLGG